ncbi:MAG TPA: cytochrome c maturation protein CcmE [Polyangiaceae bacterium]|nr:cytochrome c maturation protein CcmE [Polyangiaceae bacterium]
MSRKLLVGTLLLSAGVLFLVFEFTTPRPVYARSVSEFLAHPTPDQELRIEGVLVHGSLCVRHEPCEYRFRMADSRLSLREVEANGAGAQLSVHYPSCLIADTFRDTPGLDVRVVVQGKQCKGCHFFEASQVFAKMRGKYEMKERRLGDARAPGAVVIEQEETPPLAPTHECTGS